MGARGARVLGPGRRSRARGHPDRRQADLLGESCGVALDDSRSGQQRHRARARPAGAGLGQPALARRTRGAAPERRLHGELADRLRGRRACDLWGVRLRRRGRAGRRCRHCRDDESGRVGARDVARWLFLAGLVVLLGAAFAGVARFGAAEPLGAGRLAALGRGARLCLRSRSAGLRMPLSASCCTRRSGGRSSGARWRSVPPAPPCSWRAEERAGSAGRRSRQRSSPPWRRSRCTSRPGMRRRARGRTCFRSDSSGRTSPPRPSGSAAWRRCSTASAALRRRPRRRPCGASPRSRPAVSSSSAPPGSRAPPKSSHPWAISSPPATARRCCAQDRPPARDRRARRAEPLVERARGGHQPRPAAAHVERRARRLPPARSPPLRCWGASRRLRPPVRCRRSGSRSPERTHAGRCTSS